jgi:hypothetical protein
MCLLWFVVLPDDYGIRPAGAPDRCFYCDAQVGQFHGLECPMIEKKVAYDVLADGIKIGTWSRNEPYCWDDNRCEFHKNEGTWCADNALDVIEWLDHDKALEVRKKIDALADDECACDLLVFRVSGIIDPGPFRVFFVHGKA